MKCDNPRLGTKMISIQRINNDSLLDRPDGAAAQVRYRWHFIQWYLWLPYLIALMLMFLLKRHYSMASADELRWILQPVGWLVNGWDRLPYAWESGIGLVRADQRITIAPACAGVNFLIMAYGLMVFAFLHHQRTLVRRAAWLAGAFVAAYAVSIMTNAARIVLAITLYDADVDWGALTPERMHTIAGIAVYSGALGLYYAVLQRIITAEGRTSWPLRGFWLPWIWYVTGAVAVPVAHRAWIGQDRPELGYCLTVVGISSLIWGTTQLCCTIITICRSNINKRRQRNPHASQSVDCRR